MNTTDPDPDSDEAIIARHRDYFRTVHPDVKAAAMRAAETKQDALANAQQALQTALGQLQALMKQTAPAGQSDVERAARDWLASIGSDPA